MGRKAALIRGDEGNPDSPETLEEERPCIHDAPNLEAARMKMPLSRRDTLKLVRFLA